MQVIGELSLVNLLYEIEGWKVKICLRIRKAYTIFFVLEITNRFIGRNPFKNSLKFMIQLQIRRLELSEY